MFQMEMNEISLALKAIDINECMKKINTILKIYKINN